MRCDVFAGRYVCLKERNMLQSDREAYRRQGKVMPNPTRITKVCCLRSAP